MTTSMSVFHQRTRDNFRPGILTRPEEFENTTFVFTFWLSVHTNPSRKRYFRNLSALEVSCVFYCGPEKSSCRRKTLIFDVFWGQNTVFKFLWHRVDPVKTLDLFLNFSVVGSTEFIKLFSFYRFPFLMHAK